VFPRSLTWIELREYIDSGRGPIVIPIGSLEGHGAHLPIDTDALIASFVADELAKRNGWVSLPPIVYTIAVPVRPGNVYVEPRVFRAYLSSILSHFVKFGQKSFIVILGHGGPEIKSAVADVCSDLCREREVDIAAFHIANILSRLGLVDTSRDRHAGGWETSIVLAIDPSLVKDVSVYSRGDFRRYGVVGDPTRASTEAGRRYVASVIEYMERVVKGAGVKGCYLDWIQGG